MRAWCDAVLKDQGVALEPMISLVAKATLPVNDVGNTLLPCKFYPAPPQRVWPTTQRISCDFHSKRKTYYLRLSNQRVA